MVPFPRGRVNRPPGYSNLVATRGPHGQFHRISHSTAPALEQFAKRIKNMTENAR